MKVVAKYSLGREANATSGMVQDPVVELLADSLSAKAPWVGGSVNVMPGTPSWPGSIDIFPRKKRFRTLRSTNGDFADRFEGVHRLLGLAACCREQSFTPAGSGPQRGAVALGSGPQPAGGPHHDRRCVDLGASRRRCS